MFLQLHDEKVSVHFTDEQEVCVPRTLLDRSAVLRQVLCDNEGAENISLPLPQEYLQRWLQWRTNESSWDLEYARYMEEIVQFLEVRAMLFSSQCR